MRISLADSSANGFKKWSDAHKAISAADNAIVAGDQDLDRADGTPRAPRTPAASGGLDGD
jgi:hypothetical protein